MASSAVVTYREATLGDVDAIRDVARTTWEHDYPNVVNREVVTDTVETWYAPDQIAADVRRGDALVLVAERADATSDPDDEAAGETTVVGFLHGIVDDDCGTVLRAYVHPDARSEGFGRGLVHAAIEAFAERGCDQVEAMVLARNDPGNAFYGALGFERVSTDTTIIGGEGYDEHVYRKYL